MLPGQHGGGQAFPSLSQLLGSSGNADVLLDQPEFFINGKRRVKRGRRSEVEYQLAFPGYPGQEAW